LIGQASYFAANQLAAHMDFAPEDVDRVARFWGYDKIASKPGLKAVDMFDAVADGRVKAIWIMGTNPVDSLPDADKVARALAACPVVVVSDVVAQTDTMRFANIVLPAAAWGEKDGTVTNSERRISRQRPFMPAPGEAKPDWWQMAQVARRMAYSGFDYEDPNEIFAEHARMSDFENNGSRDFDIGAWAKTDHTAYDAMQPFRWPVRADGSTQERFFADGGFFTPDRKARFVAVASPEPRQIADSYPLTLNTGRLRDHWHTMTRTGRSSRLSAHTAEPHCELHPLDAAANGIADADLVTVESPLGAVIVRALITGKEQRGSVYVPLHWTNSFASKARIDTLVPLRTDPFSGQPAFKNVGVNVTRFEASTYGFIVSRRRIDASSASYWATVPCVGGWRTEFALRDGDKLDLPAEAAVARHDTKGHGQTLWFDGDRLEVAMFTASAPVAVARSWAVEQLSCSHNVPARHRLCAGRPAADQPDKGAIVCSCCDVGVNEIAAAIGLGARSVDAVGDACRAGTNCGSCRSEINEMLSQAEADHANAVRIAAE
ncbi:MAG: molybdopterin-dependent oxidoreductase, partial [Pseudomonadota bacterium]